MAFDDTQLRGQFPILAERVNGESLVYLDNAATVQKPEAVIDAIADYYRHDNANVHRGVHKLSQRATTKFEEARAIVAKFINAPETAECIFVRGVTEAVNLVAASWGRANLSAGDVILLGAQEHHSNIVPWQLAAEATGATVKVIPMNDDGVLDVDAFHDLLDGVKMLSFPHVSNSLGTINPVKEMAAAAKAAGAVVMVDGAQWVAHGPTDVQDLSVDFYTFSAHKLYGPTGIGVLWGRRELLDAMSPYHGGGDMIETVTWEKTTYAALPNKFEAGTPHIAGAVGLGAAIDWLSQHDLADVALHEEELRQRCEAGLLEIDGIRIIGNAPHKAGVVSFVHDSVSTYDLGVELDKRGIAVRTGHHCTQPVMDRLGIPGTARASFAIYNTKADVDALIEAVKTIITQRCSAAADPKPTTDTLTWPEPTADSVQAAADALAADFELVAGMMKPDEYVLEFADKLPPMPADAKTEANKVHGCMSTVHLISRKRDDRVDLLADSDAHIVRGLIGLLEKLFSGQRAEEILAFDVAGFLKKIGLDAHLSMGRRNGLAGMINRIRSDAIALTDTDTPSVETTHA
ncbi:MAG: SufS family cysteine desulfurase [Planctomycetota bacterium]